MDNRRLKCIRLLQEKFFIEKKKAFLVLQHFSDFQVDVFYHLCTDSFLDFEKWFSDVLLLKSGNIEALERQYRFLINKKKEFDSQEKDCFFLEKILKQVS